MVTSHDIGRSNALRANYVQIWGSTPQSEGAGGNSLHAVQAFENFEIDRADIKRSGLRTYVTTFMHDQPGQKVTRAKAWKDIISDWTVNGHLKTNGTIIMTGVYEPICVGDNIQWNNTIFHIEQVIHDCQINPVSGLKAFRTIVKVSNGLSLDSDKSTTKYPSMKNVFRENLASDDPERIYPGFVDVQDIGDRIEGEEQQTRRQEGESD
jgi:hypothetical protein